MAKDNIEKNYGRYGKIKWIEKYEKTNADIYALECIPKEVDAENVLLNSIDNVKFLIADRNETKTVTIFCFRIAKKKNLGDNALEILNEVNKEILYGKFTIDSDEEIDWEYTYEEGNIDEVSVRDFLDSCLSGIAKMVILSMREQKKEDEVGKTAESKE